MKRYFDFKLSGRTIVLPLWAMFVVAIISVLPELYAEDFYVMTNGNVVADAVYFAVTICVGLLSLIVPTLLLYPITKATIEACGMDGEKIATDYSFGRYACLVVKGSLLSIVTLGIYLPWFLVKLTRYFFEGATYRLRPFGFHAKPMPLFVILTLLLFVPMVLLGILLSYVVLGYESSGVSEVTMALAAVLMAIVVVAWSALFCTIITGWMLNLSVGDERVVGDIPKTKTTIFIMGQIMLTIITLGLYTPMMELQMMRYFAECTRVGEGKDARRLGMTLHAWRDWGYVWLQLLLVVVTLGLYMPWYYAKILNRFIPRIYVED